MEESGLDKSRFTNLTGDQFDCVICQEVVFTPKECSGCGSLFCQNCIDAWLKKQKQCPNRCNENSTKIRNIEGALLRMYNNLTIKCKNFIDCKTTLSVSDMIQHEKNCSKPKCINFQVCGNKSEFQQDGRELCDPSCLLLTQLIPKQNDPKAMLQIIKSFLSSNYQAQQNTVQKVIANPVQKVPIIGIPQQINQVLQQKFRWSAVNKGTGMELSEDNTRVWLKESQYMFRTIISDIPMTQGVYYWEIIADDRTENELKIGISTKADFNFNTAFCDFEYGYAFYGLGQLRHNSNASGPQYGKRFKKEGVLGLCLNMNKGQLSFALNGEFMGIAYTNDALKKGQIYAAASLLHCAGCKIDSSKPVPSYFPL